MFLLYRFSFSRLRSTVRERNKPNSSTTARYLTLTRARHPLLPPPGAAQTFWQQGRGAPGSHIWLGGRARVTKTLIHQRSCHHNNRREGILATVGGTGAGATGAGAQWPETNHHGSTQDALRSTEPRSMQTRWREDATRVAAAAVPAGGDQACR